MMAIPQNFVPRRILKGTVVPVIAAGAIAVPFFADGKMIPLAILETSTRPDLDILFNIHEHTPPGDAETTWVNLLDIPNGIGLQIKFIRPSDVTFIVQFDAEEHAVAIDQAIHTRCIYLQSGKIGDRLSTTAESKNIPRISVEIGAFGFEERWEKIWTGILRKKYRKLGKGFWDAKQSAKLHIEDIRKSVRNMPNWKV